MTGTDGMRIRIVENGPYIVEGNVPLFEKAITYDEDAGYAWRTVREIEHGPVYSLCRCGKTSDPPFCDGGAHKRFKGREVADRRPFDERCDIHEGPGIVLKDDMRCSMSRFCHRKAGTPWKLLDRSDDPAVLEEIVRGSLECPSGRMLLVRPDGSIVDECPEPAIWIIQDPGKNVSGGIYVMGGIPIIGSDGFEYETRNRAVLCRCGRSRNMPFCDAVHINGMYKDSRNRKDRD